MKFKVKLETAGKMDAAFLIVPFDAARPLGRQARVASKNRLTLRGDSSTIVGNRRW